MKRTAFLIFLLFSSALGLAQDSNKDVKDIERLSKEWMSATMNRDQKALDLIVAPEFKLSSTNLDQPGLPRQLWMENTMTKLKIDSVHYNKIRVDVVGDVAIVQSNFYWSVAFMDFPAKKDTVNLIDTWVRNKQGWQVVSRIVAD